MIQIAAQVPAEVSAAKPAIPAVSAAEASASAVLGVESWVQEFGLRTSELRVKSLEFRDLKAHRRQPPVPAQVKDVVDHYLSAFRHSKQRPICRASSPDLDPEVHEQAVKLAQQKGVVFMEKHDYKPEAPMRINFETFSMECRDTQIATIVGAYKTSMKFMGEFIRFGKPNAWLDEKFPELHVEAIELAKKAGIIPMDDAEEVQEF